MVKIFYWTWNLRGTCETTTLKLIKILFIWGILYTGAGRNSFDATYYTENDGGDDEVTVPFTIAEATFYGAEISGTDRIYRFALGNSGENITSDLAFNVSTIENRLAVDDNYFYFRGSSNSVRRVPINTEDGQTVSAELLTQGLGFIAGVAVADSRIYIWTPQTRRIYVRNLDGSADRDFSLPTMPPKIQPCGRTLVHSPLTPPIPRPRQTFTGFKGVPPRAEDDSVVGRSSNRVQHRLSSTPSYT